MKTTAVPIARHGAKQQPAAGALGTVAVAVVSALSSIHWKDLKINNKQSGKRVSFFHFVTTWVSEERKNTRETQLCKKKNISQWRWSGKVFNFLHESRAHTIKKKRKQRTYIKKRKKYSMGLWEQRKKGERWALSVFGKWVSWKYWLPQRHPLTDTANVNPWVLCSKLTNSHFLTRNGKCCFLFCFKLKIKMRISVKNVSKINPMIGNVRTKIGSQSVHWTLALASLMLPPHLFCLLNKIILDFDGFSIKLFGFLIELCAKIVWQEKNERF